MARTGARGFSAAQLSLKVLIDRNAFGADPKGPRVLLVRGQNTLPESLGDLVTAALRRHGDELISGALVTVEEGNNRVRILPI